MRSFGEGRRYELAVLLTAMREQAGYTQAQVAEQLLWSPTKMSRLEGGKRAPVLSDLLLLLPLYSIPAAQHEPIMKLARSARAKPLYDCFSDILDDCEITYYEAIGDADLVREHSGPLIPPILRTRQYDNAVHAAGIGPIAPGRWLALMNEVQPAILTHIPENLIFVMDESALKRQVGTRTIMREQRQHLDSLSAYCQILYVPFDAGPFGADSFSLLHWKHDPHTMLCLPGRVAPMHISRNAKAIRTANTIWSQLVKVAKPI